MKRILFGCVENSNRGQMAEALAHMGCGDDYLFVPAKHREDWEIPYSKVLPDAQFRIIRDDIEFKVKNNLNRL